RADPRAVRTGQWPCLQPWTWHPPACQTGTCRRVRRCRTRAVCPVPRVRPAMRRKLGTTHAFVALGANLPSDEGAPEDTLRKAIAALIPLSQHLPVISSFYESDPKDCPPGSPQYVNAVVAIMPKPDEDPFSLLQKLQQIEDKYGRVRSGVRNEARTLDLDLLT